MHRADLTHPNQSLQEKLEALYALNRHTPIDLGFRPPYVALLEQLGNPQEHLPPIIHVAGTNGKGSTLAMMRSMLESGGYTVHAYTSPHLVSFNERIVLGGQPIADDLLEGLIDEALVLNADAPITFFEVTTAIAFKAFSEAKADLLLLETGLGGRLDSTNIISKPAVSVITRISLDHTEFLGPTYQDIAREKAGIMKYDTPCIVGIQGAEGLENGVMNSFVDASVDKNVALFCAGKDWSCEPEGAGDMIFKTADGSSLHLPPPDLPGAHQIENAGAALAALHVLRDQFPLTEKAMAEGLRNVRWPARLQRIDTGPLAALLPAGWELWLDGGHNDSAGAALGVQAAAWQAQDGKALHLICGMKGDKDPAAFLAPLAPYLASFTPTAPDGVGKAARPEDMAGALDKQRTAILPETQDFSAAVRGIVSEGQGPGRILICGSLYLAQKVLKDL